MKKHWCKVAVLALFAFSAVEIANGVGKSCGPPPRAKPQRRKGGESFPPLPLPATPLRRTEKKRPPAPPALIGKIQYGKVIWQTDAQGRRTSYRDWTTDPADIQRLVRLSNSALGIRYRPIHTTFAKFSYNPAEIPILYLTGHEAFTLDTEMRRRLQLFLNDGGYLIGDACCGSEDFYNAFCAEMQKIFPNNPLRLLEPDHAVFRSNYKIDGVEAIEEGKSIGRIHPPIMGINIGCRTAVMVWPYDLSCGWDGHTHERGKRIAIKDARRLGVNVMAYCLANYELGRFLSTQRVYHQTGEHTRDEFVFALAAHSGDWDPTPNGVMSFLRYTRINSTLPVQFKRTSVRFNDPDILNYPMVYMTGHTAFKLSDAEIAGLRNYLRNSGMIFASACCGSEIFDAAFRALMAKALPDDVKLANLPLDHPVYSSHTPITTVTYSRMLRAQHPDLKLPTLEGVSLNGRLAIVYSRFGLSTEWDGQDRPYALCYEPTDSRQIGLNVLIYAMTH